MQALAQMDLDQVSAKNTKILLLFTQFFNQTSDTSAINRAHLILIPKLQRATAPNDYRPISLQNCPIKAITKVLANRFQQPRNSFMVIKQALSEGAPSQKTSPTQQIFSTAAKKGRHPTDGNQIRL
jgi:hypothetical protein